ncbi:MAG: VCBS repeat-containing protein [Bacteroidales bacterium]|nr:VCBS repeat-containing protein [Candidatus Latescibacterota bacterium]
MNRTLKNDAGFTLVEMVISILVLGFVLISVAGVFVLFQKGAAQTGEYTEAQQNTRVALDYITEHLRQAGSQTDYFRGQRPIAHAGPYQIVINADIDNGEVIDGQNPLTAYRRSSSPNTVPVSGTSLYQPAADYDSDAETIAFTLDSTNDGLINKLDRGDDTAEDGPNTNLFVLKKHIYGNNGGINEVRENDLAIIRGPNLAATWITPEPLFQYYYDNDDDITTDDILWGDSDNSGKLSTAEITGITAVPDNLLGKIRKVRITSISESNRYDKKHETNGGFINVTMTSEIYVRNMTRATSTIQGQVYHDIDSDGSIDPGETGIPKVEIRIAGQNRNVLTDSYGRYYIPLPAGDYSIQEVDPMGYTSTTANLVSVTLVSGQSYVVNFGDISSTPFGIIHGVVFEDTDKDGTQGPSEDGIQGVSISLDNGATTRSSDVGYYSFVAQQGNYIVVETDPTGLSSTTPNSVPAAIVDQDDTVTINFGDFAGDVTGTLEGYVYKDINEDGVRNSMEDGIPNVSVIVSNGDSMMTNADGYYRFNLDPDIYKITERDPMGYTSTTVNVYADILIVADTTVVRDFGDVLEEKLDFVEIHISNTDRVLSVSTGNLNEDDKYDTDIVLGTALATGIGNMLVFHNNWETSQTPVHELFNSEPVYRRDAGYNINTMSRYDFSGDGTVDILSGLEISTERNLQLWYTEAEGILSTSPSKSYFTTGMNEVMDSKLADFNNDGDIDILVGLRTSIGTTGAFEIMEGSGAGNFTAGDYVTHAGPEDIFVLGAVWAVGAGDIDGDGDQDVIVGTHITPYTGFIDVYTNDGIASATFTWHSRYNSWGAVNDIMIADMQEDDSGDPDIVASMSMGPNFGFIMLWNNDGGVFGEPDTTGFVFGPKETPNFPTDWVDAMGEPLSMGLLYVNNDVFPDITYGTRSSSLYTGDIYILPSYGTLPENGFKINTTDLGEIISIDVADFNKDSRPDIVVGTRSSATQGKLVAYFGREL